MVHRGYERKEDEFVENNIRFRIISSKMLERFKNTQSFTLTEMLHGQYQFSKTAREIMLLSMDKWFQWLLLFERELIRNPSDVFDENMCLEMIQESHETTRLVREILMKHTEVFERDMTEIWLTSTETGFLGWSEVLAAYSGKEDIEAFSGIATFLTEIMETMKFILYEIDYLVSDGSDPFICLTNTCHLAKTEYGIDILSPRINTYKSFFPEITRLTMKNYSDIKSIKTCASELSTTSIEIVPEEMGTI